MQLSDDLWNVLSPLIPEPKPRHHERRGRPWIPNRPVLAGILWVLSSGARWADLPRGQFPPYQTCHRRFQQWNNAGLWHRIMQELTAQLRRAGRLDLAEGFIDATYAPARKGATKWVLRRREKAPR